MSLELISIFGVKTLSVLRGDIGFFSSPPQRPITLTLKDFHPRLYQLLFCPILILQLILQEPVFPFSMLSAK